MGNRKSYMNLLKEAISEFDTSDAQDVKGPMLDPILSWEGDGELPTFKDAGSILERYYFNENQDVDIDTVEALDEADYENDKGAHGKGMQHAQGDAGPQAGTSKQKTIKGAKKEIKDEIAKEMEEIEDMVGFELSEEEQAFIDAEDLTEDEDYDSVNEDLEMENSIIEKLIAEMEADDDAQGAGTQQAGTGDADDLVPDRKDNHEEAVKPKNYNEENAMIEAVLAEMEDEDEDEDEEDLDVDAGVKESASGVPGGPSPHKRGEDWESDEAAYSEAFQIFKEAIEDDEE